MRTYISVGILAMMTLIIIIAFATGTRAITAPLNAQIDRNVMVNSHQYIEGQNQRYKIIRANLEGVTAMLAADPTNANLLAQKRALTAQLRAI